MWLVEGASIPRDRNYDGFEHKLVKSLGALECGSAAYPASLHDEVTTSYMRHVASVKELSVQECGTILGVKRGAKAFYCSPWKIWRRDRDSNPGYPFEYTRFPSVRLQPLGHLSVGKLIMNAPELRRFTIVTYRKTLLRARADLRGQKCGGHDARQPSLPSPQKPNRA
jgi:hypothetical protein